MSPELFHPIIDAWFHARFGEPTPAQRGAWPVISSGRDALIAAPTGSGKTLAAFLWCIDRLLRDRLTATSDPSPEPPTTRVLYLSPLKALGRDVARNLQTPLDEITARAVAEGAVFTPLRVAVRDGDTDAAARARMGRVPPDLLVTTPESAYVLLTSEGGRRLLQQVEVVIVDEIHAVAADKRGAHLALTLERLDALVHQCRGVPPQRVGLSATQRPIERVAALLVGAARPAPAIVDCGHQRDWDLRLEIPDEPLGMLATQPQTDWMHARIAALVGEHRATLVFTNTRRQAERTARALADALGPDQVSTHHGSLARKQRRETERRLAEGELRCVVATASLELGIDVGPVDLVVQIGSPRLIHTFLQRVGRASHHVGGRSRGHLFALTRDQAVESAALLDAARAGELDSLTLPEAPLDVLAQQMVAEVAAAGEYTVEALFGLVTRAEHYRALPRATFDRVVEMLSEGIAARRGRRGAHLHHDAVHGRLRPRRGARLTALTSGGAIPERGDYRVIAEPDEAVVGTVDEDFAIESMAGDVFLLGSTAWRVLRVERGQLRVQPAPGATPTVPFWFGEAPARSSELSTAVGRLRRAIGASLAEGGAIEGLTAEWASRLQIEPRAAAQILEYLAAGRAALGALPDDHTIIVERFFDQTGGAQLVVHAPLGARINRAWGLALRKRFCVTFDFELQAAATDDGFVLSLGLQHSFPLATVFDFLQPESVAQVLTQAVLTAPLFNGRWRWTVTRALAAPRFRGGKRVPPPLQRMEADDLLAAVFPDAAACQENLSGPIEPPDHPLVDETLRDCLTDYLDLPGLVAVLEAVRSGALETRAVETTEASPLSHEILNANPYAFLDDAPLEERRTQAVALRSRLGSADFSGNLGQLDAEIIAAVAAEAWPTVRSPDEAHDLLLTTGLWPAHLVEPGWEPHFQALADSARARRWRHDPSDAPTEDSATAGETPTSGWVATERAAWLAALWPRAVAPAGLDDAVTPAEHEAWRRRALLGHLQHRGPTTVDALAAALHLPRPLTEATLLALETEGSLLRGPFTEAARESGALEFCERALLARIHRRTLGKLRREIEPVSRADLMRALIEWHGLNAEPRARPTGKAALLNLIGRLQGCELPAGAWEADVLAPRLQGYDPQWLDQLCLEGEVVWGRLTPRALGMGATPQRNTPITLCHRADLSWLLSPADEDAARAALSPAALAVHDALAQHGAAFPAELQRLTGRLPGEVDDALWALVAAGLATADGFAVVRRFTRRRGTGGVRATGGRSVDGRRPRAPRPPWWSRGQAAGPLGGGALGGGRWALLRARCEPAVDLVAAAHLLLQRYGVLHRDLLARETWAPPWRDLVWTLRQLEAQGEVRGGRFVSGLFGEQFALPLALERLRALRRQSGQAPGQAQFVRICAADPLNLMGILFEGPRLLPSSDNAVLLRDGVPVAMREAGALRVLRPDLVPSGLDAELRLQPEGQSAGETQLTSTSIGSASSPTSGL